MGNQKSMVILMGDLAGYTALTEIHPVNIGELLTGKEMDFRFYADPKYQEQTDTPEMTLFRLKYNECNLFSEYYLERFVEKWVIN